MRKSQNGTRQSVGGPPKPRTGPKPRLALATAKALYAYQAQDADELSLDIGDVIEIITEGLYCSCYCVLCYCFCFRVVSFCI